MCTESVNGKDYYSLLKSAFYSHCGLKKSYSSFSCRKKFRLQQQLTFKMVPASITPGFDSPFQKLILQRNLYNSKAFLRILQDKHEHCTMVKIEDIRRCCFLRLSMHRRRKNLSKRFGNRSVWHLMEQAVSPLFFTSSQESLLSR